MRLLLIHRYFYPENVSLFANNLAYISKFLIDGCNFNSIDIVTLSSKKYSRPLLAGYESKISVIESFSEIDRRKSFFFRFKNLIILYFRFLTNYRRNKYSHIIITSYPPFLSGLISLTAKLFNKKIKILYYVQDIQIEYFKFKILNKLLLAFIKLSIRNSDKIITLSEDMKSTLIKINNNIGLNQVHVIQNFYHSSVLNSEIITNSSCHFKFKYDLIYAGSLGKYQQILNFIKFFEKCLKINDSLKFIIYGEGTEKENIKKYIKKRNLHKNILINDYICREKLATEIRNSKISLVSMSINLLEFAYPSKIISSLYEGKMIAITAPKNSNIDTYLSKNNIGFSVDIWNYDERSIKAFIENIQKINISSKKIIEFANKEFSTENYFKKFKKVINSLNNEA